ARDVSVSFLRQHIEPEGVLQPPQRGFARTTNEQYFGEPAVDSLQISGPYQPSAARDTPSRRKIFVCRPSTSLGASRRSSPGTQASEDGCARRILSTIARRANRRPPTAAEVRTLVEFYRAGRADGDFDLGIER